MYNSIFNYYSIVIVHFVSKTMNVLLSRKVFRMEKGKPYMSFDTPGINRTAVRNSRPKSPKCPDLERDASSHVTAYILFHCTFTLRLYTRFGLAATWIPRFAIVGILRVAARFRFIRRVRLPRCGNHKIENS